MASIGDAGSENLWPSLSFPPRASVQSRRFVVIPAGHKSRFEVPAPKTTSIDLPLITHLPAKAGDVVLFMGGQVYRPRLG